MRSILSVSFLLLTFLLPASGFGQSFQAFKKAGDKAFETGDFNAALQYYEQALAKKEKDAYINYRCGLSAEAFAAYELATSYFHKAIKNDETGAYNESIFHLGLIHKTIGDYEKAIDHFNSFLNTNPGERLKAKTVQHIAACGNAMELLKVKPETEVVHLGKSINTGYSEFGAIKRGDTLYYASYRFNNRSDRTKPPRKIAKTLISVKNGRGRLLRKYNSESRHTAHTAFSMDGNRIYYNICKYDVGVEIICTLFYREKDKRGRWKSTGIALPDTINLEGYTATQPAIGYDTIRKKEILFFASNRPGGEGGLDIWEVVVEDKKSFGNPKPVAALNSEYDEITPFYDIKNHELYFSSDRPESMGGYDIFSIAYYESSAVTDQLLPPLNSSYNDIYFTKNEDSQTGILSSNRPGTYYLDKSNKACCNDIFFYRPKPPKTEIDTTSLVFADNTPIPENVDEIRIEKEPEKLQDFLPLALYFDNDEPDKRTRRTETRKNYDDTYLKYARKKALFVENFSAPLDEAQKEEAKYLVEDFFDNYVEKGHRHLMLFSEILLNRLQRGETVEIFIKGFTSPRAKSDYNLALGKRRVSCLKNHFFDYRSGIFMDFIKTGNLKITERSFGETSAASGVSDALEDLRNSIYSPAASRERRVEIVEITISD
jgi:tetratricopeptide (TPR) repeat protein